MTSSINYNEILAQTYMLHRNSGDYLKKRVNPNTAVISPPKTTLRRGGGFPLKSRMSQNSGKLINMDTSESPIPSRSGTLLSDREDVS